MCHDLEARFEVSEGGVDRVPDDVQLVLRLVARRPVALVERVLLGLRVLLLGLLAAMQHVVAQPHVAERAHVPLQLRRRHALAILREDVAVRAPVPARAQDARPEQGGMGLGRRGVNDQRRAAAAAMSYSIPGLRGGT